MSAWDRQNKFAIRIEYHRIRILEVQGHGAVLRARRGVHGSTEQRGDDGFRWSINLTSGRLTPIVTGLGNPGVMAFISTGSHLNAPKLLIGKAPWVSVSEMERL